MDNALCFRFGGVDGANANSNNVAFTIKHTKLYVPVVNCQQRSIKNYQNFWAKDLNDQRIGISIKPKMKIKI